MIRLISLLFRIYQVTLSPLIETAFNVRCRYEETCSRYMERSLREKGIVRGFIQGLKRLLSCNQWSGHG